MSTEKKIYTAKEVRDNGPTDETITAELAQATYKAYEAANRGELSATYYPDSPALLPVLGDRLSELGYKVRRNPTFFTSPEFLIITWSEDNNND